MTTKGLIFNKRFRRFAEQGFYDIDMFLHMARESDVPDSDIVEVSSEFFTGHGIRIIIDEITGAYPKTVTVFCENAFDGKAKPILAVPREAAHGVCKGLNKVMPACYYFFFAGA